MKAQAAAWRLTKRFGFQHPREINVEDIACARKVLVVPGKPQGCEARLARKGNRGIICVRAGMDETGRRRFSIAHELGHWELHNDSQWFVCSSADLRDYKKSPQEIEANTFAAELLMPTRMVAPRCEKPLPTLELVKGIANEFDVSLTAAALRVLYLTKHECVLVASQGRQIKWWKPNSDRFGVFLEKGQPLNTESLAWHAFNGEADASVMEEVPIDAWFPNRPSQANFAVTEQSLHLPRYDTVLTLLTIDDADED